MGPRAERPVTGADISDEAALVRQALEELAALLGLLLEVERE